MSEELCSIDEAYDEKVTLTAFFWSDGHSGKHMEGNACEGGGE